MCVRLRAWLEMVLRFEKVTSYRNEIQNGFVVDRFQCESAALK